MTGILLSDWRVQVTWLEYRAGVREVVLVLPNSLLFHVEQTSSSETGQDCSQKSASNQPIGDVTIFPQNDLLNFGTINANPTMITMVLEVPL